MEWGGTDQQLFQCFSASTCKSREVKILLLLVRTPACEGDTYRIQVTGVDAVLICSLYNLKELKSKPHAPSRLTLKMRTIPPFACIFVCYEQLRDPWLLRFDPRHCMRRIKKCNGSIVNLMCG